jgi:two-component system, sensor histidine kinase
MAIPATLAAALFAIMPFPSPKAPSPKPALSPWTLLKSRKDRFLASQGIRSRIMLAVLFSSLALTILLCIFFTSLRFKDLEEAYLEKGKALLRQLVVACEYPLFSGNRNLVLQIVAHAHNTPDVIGVAVLDPEGRPLASTGSFQVGPPAGQDNNARPMGESAGIWHFREAVIAGLYPLEELLDEPPNPPPAPPLLGHILLDMSTEGLWNRQFDAILASLLIFFTVAFLGIFFARLLGESVARPVRRIAQSVERIGAGHLEERVSIVAGGSLGRLAEGVNEMAFKLSHVHERMAHEIEAATAQLRASKEEAERSNLAKSRFLAAASHDLRQPMHAMGLFISALLRHALPFEVQQGIEKVATSAKAMEELLDSLLDISRLDAGILEPRCRAYPIQDSLDRLSLHFDEPARLRNLRLIIRPSPLFVHTDPILLDRILSNLVSNALRYTPGGTVWVGVRKRQHRICLEVRDSGVGIEPSAQEIIFQEFVQLAQHASSRREGQGMGLGLAIVRRMSELLGHQIRLRSIPGKGSVFQCLMRPAPKGVPVSKEAAEGPKLSPTVLLVAPTPIDELETLLTRWGLACIQVPDHKAALKQGHRLGSALSLLIYQRGATPVPLRALLALRQAVTPDKPLIILGQSIDTKAPPLPTENIVVLKVPLQPARLRALLARFGGEHFVF